MHLARVPLGSVKHDLKVIPNRTLLIPRPIVGRVRAHVRGRTENGTIGKLLAPDPVGWGTHRKPDLRQF